MLPLQESWFDKLTMSGRTDFAQALAMGQLPDQPVTRSGMMRITGLPSRGMFRY